MMTNKARIARDNRHKAHNKTLLAGGEHTANAVGELIYIAKQIGRIEAQLESRNATGNNRTWLFEDMQEMRRQLSIITDNLYLLD